MKKVILAAIALAPAFAFAQGTPNLSNIDTLVQAIGNIVELALPIVVGIALLVFFWGLVKFIFAQGNEESKADAKKIMLWGLVQFIGTALGINQGQTITVPTVPGL